jgi:SAM-dependent methyltransferase
MAASDAATPVVGAFYDRFPYPGDPLQDGPPPGYNWRWCVDSAWAFASGCLPPLAPGGTRPWRILDAGCGTGVSTDYLCHLNPTASVLAVDISAGALELARERTRRSGAIQQVRELRIEQRSLLDLAGEESFDYINSVGVLHHLDQPEQGLRALADRLRPGGLLHLFLYAKGGRWEIHRTQRSLMRLGVGSGVEGL